MTKRLIISAALSFLICACASTPDSEKKATAKGAGIGAAAGGILGAVVGHQMGKDKEGAIAGAVLGGVLGGHMAKRMDQQAQELQKVAETKRTDEGLISRMKGDILFDTGKATLKPKAEQDLKEMATIMKKYPENLLTINGYTDDTGSAKVNQDLSHKRAEAVKQTLVSSGLPEATIQTQGWGPAKPVADNKSTDGRQKNRRVEIDVKVDPSKVPAQK